MQVPADEEGARAMIAQFHEELTDCFLGHIDAVGHSILPLENEDVVFGKKYIDVLGESGATYYLRRKFQPSKFPDWGVYNEGVMNAFYHKKSIKNRTASKGIQCSDDWMAEESEGSHDEA